MVCLVFLCLYFNKILLCVVRIPRTPNASEAAYIRQSVKIGLRTTFAGILIDYRGFNKKITYQYTRV